MQEVFGDYRPGNGDLRIAPADDLDAWSIQGRKWSWKAVRLTLGAWTLFRWNVVLSRWQRSSLESMPRLEDCLGHVWEIDK